MVPPLTAPHPVQRSKASGAAVRSPSLDLTIASADTVVPARHASISRPRRAIPILLAASTERPLQHPKTRNGCESVSQRLKALFFLRIHRTRHLSSERL